MITRTSLFDQLWIWIETPGSALPPRRESVAPVRRGSGPCPLLGFGRNRRADG